MLAAMAVAIILAIGVRWVGDRRDYSQLVLDYETSLIRERNARLTVPRGMKVDFFPDQFAKEVKAFRALYPSVKAYEQAEDAPRVPRSAKSDSITTLATIGCVVALTFNAWIVFRVVDEWWGLLAALASVALLPLTMPFLAIVMLFVPSAAAGPLAMWSGILVVGILRKHSIFSGRV